MRVPFGSYRTCSVAVSMKLFIRKLPGGKLVVVAQAASPPFRAVSWWLSSHDGVRFSVHTVGSWKGLALT